MRILEHWLRPCLIATRIWLSPHLAVTQSCQAWRGTSKVTLALTERDPNLGLYSR